MLYQVEQRGRQTAFVGEDGAGLVGLYPLLARAAAIAENENSSFAEALSLAAAERGTPLRRVFSDDYPKYLLNKYEEWHNCTISYCSINIVYS